MRALASPVTLGVNEVARIAGPSDSFAFVCAGATKLVAHASAGREQVVAFHFAGDLVWIGGRSAHNYSVCALTGARLLTFDAAKLIAAASEDGAIVTALLDRVLLALSRTREKAVALGRLTASERIAGFIRSMEQRIGTGPAEYREIALPMLRRDIADSLGLTIETVCRQFSEMRTEGIIETQGRAIVRIRNAERLDDRAGNLSQAN